MTFSLTGPCPSTSAGLILKVLGDKTQKKQKQNKQNILKMYFMSSNELKKMQTLLQNQTGQGIQKQF